MNDPIEKPPTACRRCGGAMSPSKALTQTWGGKPEWPGDTMPTLSPQGPGRLVDCLKCTKCGYSISSTNGQDDGKS